MKVLLKINQQRWNLIHYSCNKR